MTTNTNANFEIRVEVSRIKETADQLSCQSMFQCWGGGA